MDVPLVIQFTPDRKDYIRASRTLATNSTGFIIIAAVIILVMTAAAVVLVFPSIVNDAIRSGAVFAFLGGAFLIFYYLTFIPLQMSRAYKSNEYLRLERRLTFRESNVVMQVGDNISNLSWDKFDDNSVYPFIPKSAFTTDTSEEEFLGLIEEKGIPIK